MECRKYSLGEMNLFYFIEDNTGHTSMLLLPQGEKPVLKKYEQNRAVVGSLCHLALRNHAQGNGAGGTMKYGETVERLKFRNQIIKETKEQCQIITELEDRVNREYVIYHVVNYVTGERGIEIETIFQNTGKSPIVLDMLTSFSLDNLSPLQEDDGAYKIFLHRFHGGWSLEGKHRVDSAENMNLGSTWFPAFPESERYGAVGSFPVNRWFPFGCVEDREKNIFWAAQLAVNSSWQIEFSRFGEEYSLSGGLGDCETASWWKTVRPGEEFRAPKAYISVDRNLEKVCQNITGMFQKYVDIQPEIEQELPIWFNEWCTSWGNPTYDSVLAAKDSLKGIPIAGIVIDAGWSTQPEGVEPQEGNGDWECDRRQFPEGLKVLSEKLENERLELGIWMEFEITSRGARVHEKDWDGLHLKRNGELIQTGVFRRFWDFRQPETIQYLRKKVIQFLKENKIHYLKVDYNGSIGLGCDGAESLGEGLRQQMEAVYAFFLMLREEIPELVIENCASGGHRLEPKMMSATALSSFSDAHECKEIPYIAANLHYLILPRQSLIWAVLNPQMENKEFCYRIISTVLGRMCLSGNVEGLSCRQKELLSEGCRFYQKSAQIIKSGESQIIRNCTDNPHHLKGYQILMRTLGNKMLVVFHSFEKPEKQIGFEIGDFAWIIKESFGEGIGVKIENGRVILTNVEDWQAYAFILERTV